MKRLLATALVATTPLLFLGCGKDNPVKPPPGQALASPDRTTPEHALLYMTFAFESRDSVRTDSVYADDYQGSSVDMTDPSPVVFSFTKSDEIRVVSEMKQSGFIAAVDVNFYASTTWPRLHYASDPPDWVTLQVPHFRISIYDSGGSGYGVNSEIPGGVHFLEFTLRPRTPDPSSPTDTTWTIVRWVESRSQN